MMRETSWGLKISAPGSGGPVGGNESLDTKDRSFFLDVSTPLYELSLPLCSPRQCTRLEAYKLPLANVASGATMHQPPFRTWMQLKHFQLEDEITRKKS